MHFLEIYFQRQKGFHLHVLETPKIIKKKKGAPNEDFF